MNERIKKLLSKSREECFHIGSKPATTVGYDELEKFAELIVQECLNKISGLIVLETFEQDIEPYEKWNQALGHAALEIEQHFYGDTE